MLPIPTKFTLLAGSAEGPTRLNAFDNALLQAGIGNVNLVRVSSILPPGAVEHNRLEIIPGQLMPTAYGTVTSEVAGELISAAVAVAIGDHDQYGVIMEFSGRTDLATAKKAVSEMAENAFVSRNRRIETLLVRGCEWQVEHIGCAFAAVALWY